jgi:hypothetical protein
MESGINGSTFLDFWHNAMLVGVVVLSILGIVVYIYHKVKVASKKDPHQRYDYLNTKEIRNYKIATACFGLAGMCVVNLYGMDTVHEMGVWFLARLSMSVAGGTLVGYISYLVLEYYYPERLNRKLNRIRYEPRINPATGNKMRLLSEAEEDVHLDEGMLAEEKVFSVDYDVWIDEKSGEVKIEKYPGKLQAIKCNSCGFFTMRIVREEITRQPEAGTAGELVKYYECSYCKSVRATAFKISTKEAADYKKEKLTFKTTKNIDLVKLEIHSVTGEKKHYEFQNADQARNFLSEFEQEK